ncbi:MAG: hypothetical protein JSV43_01485 [Methanobacteriota archaeon]|nr:MAG: hypothetical protein JSV43_01485 [Euryarchaeota archaeon]
MTIIAILNTRTPELGFWIDWEVTKVLQSVEKTGYLVLSGFIAMSVLFMAFFWWGIIGRHGLGLAEFWELASLYIVILIQSVVAMIVLNLVFKHLKRKHKDRRMRFKYILGKKERAFRIIDKALESLGLRYDEIDEGSKWFGPIPAYKVERYRISIRLTQTEINTTKVETVTRTREDYEKARDIEEQIDALLNSTA